MRTLSAKTIVPVVSLWGRADSWFLPGALSSFRPQHSSHPWTTHVSTQCTTGVLGAGSVSDGKFRSVAQSCRHHRRGVGSSGVLGGRDRAETSTALRMASEGTERWGFLTNVLSLGKRKPKPLEVEVVVIGAGVAGLVCARILTRGGFVVKLIEASDSVGGRVRTDEVDGFLLDRGFQVFIEAYPEPTRQLNYKKLNLQRFDPGAVVRCEGGFHLVSDPIRKPAAVLDALVAPVGTLVDKIRVGIHRIAIVFQPDKKIFRAPEENTYDFLTGSLELSESIVSRFFAPFYQGIFLSPLQEQSSRMFEFVFKMFSVGAASLPEGGMGQVPLQIAADLPEECVLLNTKVVSMTRRTAGNDSNVASSDRSGDDVDESPPVRLELADGSEILAYAAVVATEAPAAARLLGESALKGGALPKEGRSSTCLYFAIDGRAPVKGPILVLNGDGTSRDRPVNNVVFLEQTAPSYAPEGKSLASVTVVGDPACSDADLEERVRGHLSEWFDAQGEGEAEGKGSVSTLSTDVNKWRHLRTYRVPYAQPAQKPPVGDDGYYGRGVQLSEGVFVCGDHRATPTLDGAMRSGVLAAEAVVRSLMMGDAWGPPPPANRGSPVARVEV